VIRAATLVDLVENDEIDSNDFGVSKNGAIEDGNKIATLPVTCCSSRSMRCTFHHRATSLGDVRTNYLTTNTTKIYVQEYRENTRFVFPNRCKHDKHIVTFRIGKCAKEYRFLKTYIAHYE
jgi:hypothetical protein